MLVKKSASQPQSIGVTYPVGAGAPVMVLGGGSHGGGSRGRTLREQAGGTLGGLVGVAGALTGQHRNLGSLVQSMISGGAQGRQLGSALGRKFVGREGQAAADLREEMADKYARARASGEFDKYGISAGRTPFTNIGVMLTEQGGDSMMGRRLAELQRAKEAEKTMNDLNRQREQAHARAFGSKMGQEGRVDVETMRNIRSMFGGGMSPFDANNRVNAMNEAFNSRPTPEPADIEFPDDPYPVVVRNPMDDSPIAQGAPPLPPANNEGSAANEVNDIEQAGEKMMTETGMDHDGELTENEKALQRTLEQNQQRPDEEEEQQRPPFSQVRVRPSDQRSIFDRPE